MDSGASSASTVREEVPERVEVPDYVPAELVHWLDHHNDEVVKADPTGFMDELREKFRVFYSPAYEGFWAVTRWEDQREVMQRPQDFSSYPVGLPAGPGYGGVKLLPIALDPPEHRKYRALINPVFGPGRIGQLEDKIRTVANELIDELLVEAGSFDFIERYAEQLPTRIFIDMLGLPFAEHRKFIEWVRDILHSTQIGEGLVSKRRAGAEVNAYLTELIHQRSLERDAGEENDDVITVLLNSEVDGERLTAGEVLQMAFLLFMAGLDTVTSAHGFMLEFLAHNPEHRAQLMSEPELIPTAIEELLRYKAFVSSVRTVTHDLEFAGVQMKTGDRVWLHTGSACRDPREFEDPLTVDFHRTPNRHLAFLAGPHRCAGSNLARLELKVTLEEWHKRIPNYAQTEGGTVTYHGGGVAGLKRLPMTIAH
jgi:cytochrome P450